jgi:hypothetical protein
MKKNIKFLNLLLLAVTPLVLTSCDNEFEGEIVKDNKPAVPVTFEGATTFGFTPYYEVSFASGNISIVMSIPDNASVDIAEVTKVVAGATSINVASLNGTAGQYFASPVVVNGKTFTLNTTIAEYNTKVTGAARITAAPAAGTLEERAFMFRLTMSDGSLIVPVQCRIRILP